MSHSLRNGFISFQLKLEEDNAEETRQLCDQVRLDEVVYRYGDERLRDINDARARSNRPADKRASEAQDRPKRRQADRVDEEGVGDPKKQTVHSNTLDATRKKWATQSYLDALESVGGGVTDRASCCGCRSPEAYRQGYNDAIETLREQGMGE